MKYLMNIFDAFLLPNKQLVLGGINSDLDHLWINDIKTLIDNKTIILKRPGFDDTIIDVLDIEITNSLVDKKNFFILINNKLSTNDIISGSKLYLI